MDTQSEVEYEVRVGTNNNIRENPRLRAQTPGVDDVQCIEERERVWECRITFRDTSETQTARVLVDKDYRRFISRAAP